MKRLFAGLSLTIATVLTMLAWPALGMAETLPPELQELLPQARLAGKGNYTWFGLKIYEAQLWIGKQGYIPIDAKKNSFALELIYARSLRGKKIAEVSAEEIGRLGLGTDAQRKVWLQQMSTLFPDVKDGDSITGVYLPSQGARFYLNGKLLGEINDPEFAYAFFSIWLDEHTSAPKLRQSLLGQSNQAALSAGKTN